MNSTPFKVAMSLSLLIHGVVLSVVYGLRHEPNGAPMRFHAERSLAIEISSAPELKAPSPPVPTPAKLAEISQPVTPPVQPLDLPETKSTASTSVQAVPPEKLQPAENPSPRLAPVVEPKPDMAPPVSPTRTVSPPGPVGEVDVGVNYLVNPQPDYPAEARRRKEEGLVILAVQVSREGIPGQIQVAQSSKYPLLDEAAVRAVAQWRFTPAKHGALAVASQIQVPIRFKLSAPESNVPCLLSDGKEAVVISNAPKL